MKRRAFIRLVNENAWLTQVADLDLATLDVWPDTLQVEWLVRPAPGGSSGSSTLSLDRLRGALEALDPGLFELDIVLLLGGEYCHTTRVNIPSRQGRHIAQALPFMLEDQLAEDVDSFQFAAGPRDKAGNVEVVACNKRLLRTLVDAFDSQHATLSAIVPDMLCLPWSQGQWSFLCDARQLSLRTHPMQGLTIEMDALPVVAKSLLREGDSESAPGQIEVFFALRHLSDNLQAWLRTQFTSMVAGTDIKVEFKRLENERFPILADLITEAGALPVNLLQGDFKPMPKRKASSIRWQAAAILAGICVLLQTGYLYAQGWQYRQQINEMSQESVAIYKRYFPQDRNIRDVKRQMDAHLQKAEKSASGATFLALLAQTGEKINEANRGKPEPTVTPQRLSFDEAQGDLRIDLLASGYAELDQFKNQLQAVPLSVEVASASQEGNKVKARVRVWSASK
ncbi:General secretion pathway protein L [gamma proteobacterium HdN1]|nr:General secretion pathway protein L [gamma proteobacterium HdN1]